MHEPPRGQFEKDDVLGEVIEDENPTQPSMEAAFARLKKIATIRTSIAAFAALGFGVFALGSLQVLYLNDTLHVTNMLHRGFILSLAGWAAVPFLYPVGRYFDRTYRKNPAKALALVGLLILPSAIFTPLQVSTHSIVVVRDLGHPAGGAHGVRVRDGHAGAAGRVPVPAARARGRDGRDVHRVHRRVRRRDPRRLLHELVRRARRPSSCSSCRRASSAASC